MSGMAAVAQRERFLAVGRRQDIEALGAEVELPDVEGIRIVVDDQNVEAVAMYRRFW